MKILFASFLAALMAAPFPSILTEDQVQNNQNDQPGLEEVVAVIETNHGTIKFELYPEEAPELTKNFAVLASNQYYDGLTFHRVIEGFMIQGGDPDGNGTGGTSYNGKGLADEPGALSLKHVRGAVSWAKSSAPNSLRSQFFIVHQPSHFLDGNYSVFGQVTEGMDIVDSIAQVQTGQNDKPLEPVIMEKVYFEKK